MMSTSSSPLEDLPPECIVAILACVDDAKSLANLTLACKSLASIVTSDEAEHVWRRACFNQFASVRHHCLRDTDVWFADLLPVLTVVDDDDSADDSAVLLHKIKSAEPPEHGTWRRAYTRYTQVARDIIADAVRARDDASGLGACLLLAQKWVKSLTPIEAAVAAEALARPDRVIDGVSMSSLENFYRTLEVTLAKTKLKCLPTNLNNDEGAVWSKPGISFAVAMLSAQACYATSVGDPAECLSRQERAATAIAAAARSLKHRIERLDESAGQREKVELLSAVVLGGTGRSFVTNTSSDDDDDDDDDVSDEHEGTCPDMDVDSEWHAMFWRRRIRRWISKGKGVDPNDWDLNTMSLVLEGNPGNYYNAANSDVAHALLSGRAIPLTLTLIWCDIGARAGLNTVPVGAPGHVLASCCPMEEEEEEEEEEGEIFCDCFRPGGVLMSLDEATTMLRDSGMPISDTSWRQRCRASPQDLACRVARNVAYASQRALHAPALGYNPVSHLTTLACSLGLCAALEPDDPMQVAQYERVLRLVDGNK